jgi:hypothetical protein
LVEVDLRGLKLAHKKVNKKDPKKKQSDQKKPAESERPAMLKKAEKEAKKRGLKRTESDAGPPFPKGTRKVEYGSPPDATYHVDSKGRVIRAEGELKPPKKYTKKGVGHVKPDGFKSPRDHRGHLIPERSAKTQKHANVRENVIAEHGTKSNTSEKAAFEHRAQQHAADNPGTRMISEPQYDGNGTRPTSVKHTVVDKDGNVVKTNEMRPNPQTIKNPTR